MNIGAITITSIKVIIPIYYNMSFFKIDVIRYRILQTRTQNDIMCANLLSMMFVLSVDAYYYQIICYILTNNADYPEEYKFR